MWHILFFVSAVIAAILITLPKRNPIRKIVVRTPVILGTLLKTRSFKDTAMTLNGGGSSCQDRCCSSSKVRGLNYTGGLILGKDFILKKGNVLFWREASRRSTKQFDFDAKLRFALFIYFLIHLASRSEFK